MHEADIFHLRSKEKYPENEYVACQFLIKVFCCYFVFIYPTILTFPGRMFSIVLNTWN